MNDYRADPRIDEYIEGLPAWQKDICRKVRELVHTADPEGVINQGQGNVTARAVQIYQGDKINERALLNLFKAVIANNRTGGWRKVKQGQ